MDFNNLDYLLEGAVIIANDNEFLGKISKNQFASDSIFNKFGKYGSEYSNLSPFNKFTSTPPKIYKDKLFAYLTVNTFMSPRVDTNLLIVWLKE